MGKSTAEERTSIIGQSIPYFAHPMMAEDVLLRIEEPSKVFSDSTGSSP
jgi:hypothetical protein